MLKRVPIYWLALLSLLIACQTKPVANAILNETTALPTHTLIPPPVMNGSPATAVAVNIQAQPPTSTPWPSVTPPPTASNTPTSTNTPTPTNTPPPTFTPPALPFTSETEHYWLRRPIPEGGTVWTDKAYPYGHTRGGTLRTHHGVEFYVPRGTDILAVASGIVRVAGDDTIIVYGPESNFYGNLVIIELDSQLNGQPVYVLYAHLSEIFVEEGQHVQSQELLALSGATGVADGPHLHFEVRVGQNSYAHTRNPLLWLYPFPDRGVVVGRVIWPNGELVYEAPLSLRRVDAPSSYAVTTTYADDDVNGDEEWAENFAFDDVYAGYYEVSVEIGEESYTEEVWVYAYRTSFVEIVLDKP